MFWGKTNKPIYRFIYIYAVPQRKGKGMIMSCAELSHFSCFQLFANPMQTPCKPQKQGDCVRGKSVTNMLYHEYKVWEECESGKSSKSSNGKLRQYGPCIKLLWVYREWKMKV